MKDELLDRVNENDEVIGTVLRSEVHGDNTKIYRAIGVAVFDDNKRVLLQQRSLAKDDTPGRWTVSATGHVAAGDSPQKTALKELKEETGIVSVDLIFNRKDEYKGDEETKFIYGYYGFVNEYVEIKPQIDEVKQLKWVTLEELNSMYNNPNIDFHESSYRWIMELYKTVVK